MTVWKRLLVFVVLACLVMACIPASASAVDPLSYSAMAAAADAFGMQYGIGTTYSVSSRNGISDSFQELWDNFQSYQTNQGDSYNYQDYYDNFNEKDVVQSFTHSSGKFSGFHLDSEDVSVFTKFWNWLLSGPAEMVKVDNQYQWNTDQSGNPIPIDIYSNTIVMINGYRLYSLPVTRITSSGVHNTCYAVTGNLYALPLLVYNNPPSGAPIQPVCVIVNLDNSSFQFNWDNGSSYNSSGPDNGWYYTIMSAGWNGSFEGNMTFYDSINSQTNPSPYLGQYNVSNIESNTDGVAIDQYKNSSITLPDPTDSDYVPEAIDIVTNIPWDDNYEQEEDNNGVPLPLPATDVPGLIDNWFDAIQDDTFELEEAENNEPAPDPGEVFVPFLPVALPSFNFSLSGIWYYVRDWVSSLGAWFSTVFAVWSHIPYAIVLPVYASAVVVIVLGVYKRFFM